SNPAPFGGLSPCATARRDRRQRDLPPPFLFLSLLSLFLFFLFPFSILFVFLSPPSPLLLLPPLPRSRTRPSALGPRSRPARLPGLAPVRAPSSGMPAYTRARSRAAAPPP